MLSGILPLETIIGTEMTKCLPWGEPGLEDDERGSKSGNPARHEAFAPLFTPRSVAAWTPYYAFQMKFAEN